MVNFKLFFFYVIIMDFVDKLKLIKKIWIIFVHLLRGWLFRLYRCFDCHVYTKHSVADSLDTSQITYAMVWEDARTLREALKIQSGDKVLCVASGGDNALAMLLDDPSSVIAVDYSSAQVALCQLKQTAIKCLSYTQFLCFLGVGEEEVCGQTRLGLYQSEVRPHLTRPLKKFWDKRTHFIVHGLIYSGIYENYFLDFAKYIRPLVLSDYRASDILSAKSIEEQRAMVDTYCASFFWKWICSVYFGDVLVGRCPPFYERCDVNTGQHFYQRLMHAMRNIPVKDNYYLEYVLLGKLTGTNGFPEYMLPEHFDLLKSRIGRVRFLRSDIAECLRESGMTFDVVDMSNIFDFVPESEVKSHCEAAIEFASDGARICHWTFVPVQNPAVYQTPFSGNTRVDLTLSNNVTSKERAWFYQTFTLQHVSKHDKSENKLKPKNGKVKII